MAQFKMESWDLDSAEITPLLRLLEQDQDVKKYHMEYLKALMEAREKGCPKN